MSVRLILDKHLLSEHQIYGFCHFTKCLTLVWKVGKVSWHQAEKLGVITSSWWGAISVSHWPAAASVWNMNMKQCWCAALRISSLQRSIKPEAASCLLSSKQSETHWERTGDGVWIQQGASGVHQSHRSIIRSVTTCRARCLVVVQRGTPAPFEDFKIHSVMFYMQHVGRWGCKPALYLLHEL